MSYSLFVIGLIFSLISSVEAKLTLISPITETGAYLQSVIDATAAAPHHGDEVNIQPGTPMKLIAKIKNVGTEENIPGQVFIRFSFPKPLDTHKGSVLFETEKQSLPALTPGQEAHITFETHHKWPSLYDFIRHDWGLRNYEAVVLIDQEEEVIGSLTIAFSATYYEGPAKAVPACVPGSCTEKEAQSFLSTQRH